MTPIMPLGLWMAVLCLAPAQSGRSLGSADALTSRDSIDAGTAPDSWRARETGRPTGEATGAAAATMPHIRTDDAVLQWLLDTGSSASPTFRLLTKDIERSDVVVHLRIAAMPSGIAGKIAFGAAAGGVRYLQVMLKEPQHGTEALVILAHELQHALEVARNPRIVDAESMATHYIRHGAVRKRGTAFFVDTTDAVVVGDVVARQLQGRRWELDQELARFRESAQQRAVTKQAWQLAP